jgi:uncharacterized protein (TIGR04255 family)
VLAMHWSDLHAVQERAMSSSAPLPAYRNPPVIETVASVQFDPLANFTVAHIGLLWERFRKQYPSVEQKPPVPTIVERLGVWSPTPAGVQFELMNDFASPRVWFANADGDELVQVQNDHFIRNWRRVPRLNNEYPRYEEYVRPRFLEDFRRFQQFLKDENLGELVANQCEMTYVNHIEPNQFWSSLRDIAAVFRPWNPTYPQMDTVETINLQTVHVLRDAAGEFLGRLYVLVQTAFRGSPEVPSFDKPLIILTLTARGRPTEKGDAGVMGFLDAGRRAIVTTFDNMTTADMHKAWGKSE